jgi:hypothetical protein
VSYKIRVPRLFSFVTLLVLLLPGAALAQFGYPRPYPSYRYAQPDSSLSFSVKPKQAAVYVDGYFAGTVAEFSGFHRLRVIPGEHDIELYLQGYQSIRRHLYLSPDGSQKVTETLEKLSPGEPEEPPPVPSEPPAGAQRMPPPSPFPTRGAMPPQAPLPPGVPPPPAGVPAPPAGSEQSTRSGSLVIRVRPADADVLIDGQHWRGPSGDERLVVQVAEGRHRIEVRKDGYQLFTSEIDVRRNESVPVNVSLLQAR